jgi:hypothetical protein
MERLFPSGSGLSAIVGLTESQVAHIFQAATSDRAPVFVGYVNAPRQRWKRSWQKPVDKEPPRPFDCTFLCCPIVLCSSQWPTFWRIELQQ